MGVALAVLLAGCAGYRLGPVNGLAPGEKSVQVVPFVNQTLQPRLTDALTMQVRKQIQRDGTYQLATQNDGDIILSGTISQYGRSEISFTHDDSLTVHDFRLKLAVHVTARERSSGKVILDQQFTGTTLVRVGNDLTSSERQAQPLLADEVAKNIVTQLAEGKW
jgi:hypothetical protein